MWSGGFLEEAVCRSYMEMGWKEEEKVDGTRKAPLCLEVGWREAGTVGVAHSSRFAWNFLASGPAV